MGFGLHRIVLLRRAGHLDMSAEQRADRVALRESSESVDARVERRELGNRHVEAAWIDHVAGKQQARARIIDHDVPRLVPRRGDDVESAPAQIEVADLVRPVRDMEVGRNVFRLQAHDVSVGPIAEFGIACMVIAMAVRMRDHQSDRTLAVFRLPFVNQPIDRRADLEAARAGVDQQGAILAEEEIKEGCLEIGEDRLANHESVRVDRLHLSLGLARGRPVDPVREPGDIGRGRGGGDENSHARESNGASPEREAASGAKRAGEIHAL